MKLKNSKLPLYYQLAEKITEEIKNNNLKEDEKLPSEREYCERYKVSRSTVREAVKHLEQTGLLYRIQGKGTFVSPKMMKQNLLEFYSFTEEMKKIGKTPTSIIKSFKIITADNEISKKLNIQEKSRVYFLERIRLADEIPIMVEKTYLPLSRFPRLTKNDFIENPMYTVFMNEYNVTFEKAVEKFSVAKPAKDILKKLLLMPDIPCIKLERSTYEKDKIIEYTIGIIRGDRFQFEVILDNNNKHF
jgi:GntR family transcriptional regulator